MIPIDKWRAMAQAFDVAGNQVAYWDSADRESGGDEEAPILLLIHGYPTSSWDWSAIWPSLTPIFRVVALDMLGFGLSDKPRGFAYSIFHQADLQEALLEHLGIGDAHVLCHDYGDTVGQELLARANEGALSFALKSMCFLNGGLFPEQHRARPLQKLGLSPLGPILGMAMSERRLRTALDEVFGPQTKASDEEIAAHWAMIREQNGHRILHKLLHYIPERRDNRERWVGALSAARAPLRLIDGGADPVSGAHLFHYFKEMIDGADAVLLEDIGHYPQTEAPQAVLDAFFDFHNAMAPTASTAAKDQSS
ncbi:MAG: alpha/beta hydrolase [Pseudomonadota bacterium]